MIRNDIRNIAIIAHVSMKGGVLYGRIVDILNRGSEVAILALGMTLVVSCSAGTDISVGSVMSLAGGVCCVIIEYAYQPVRVAAVQSYGRLVQDIERPHQ